jgi:hypothetical protein
MSDISSKFKLVESSTSVFAPTDAQVRIATSINALRSHIAETIYSARAEIEARLSQYDAQKQGDEQRAVLFGRKTKMARAARGSHLAEAARAARELLIAACGDLVPTPDAQIDGMTNDDARLVSEVIGTSDVAK